MLFGLAFLAGSAGLRDPSWGEPLFLPLRVVGGILLAAGLAFVVLGLVGLRENLTPNPRPKEGGSLVESGVYGIVRHPIYTGIVAGALGWGLATASLPAAGIAVVLGAFFDIKARREEAWLRAAYPGYVAYARRVRKLVPFLY